MTTAREIMTEDPIIVDTSLSVVDIAKILDNESIGSVIVCDSDRRLRGMVTDRDLAIGVIGSERDPVGTTAGDLLSDRPVITVGADEAVEVAVQLMEENAIRRLPVVEGDAVVGIISQADLARHSADSQVGGMVEVISSAPDNTGRG